MKITKHQLRRIIKEQSNWTDSGVKDAWVDGILDFIHSEHSAAGLDAYEDTPELIAALQEVIGVLESEEANPSDGSMYGEERY